MCSTNAPLHPFLQTVPDRDGVHFDDQYFHVTHLEGGGIFTKLKGTLSRDKYRVQAKAPNGVVCVRVCL